MATNPSLAGSKAARERSILARLIELQTSIDVINGNPTVKGWINFNGTGTIAIRDSFNVSGIVDNSTGDYTVTWTTDFAGADYSLSIGAGAAPGVVTYRINEILAGSCDIIVIDGANGVIDSPIVTAVAFGAQ